MVTPLTWASNAVSVIWLPVGPLDGKVEQAPSETSATVDKSSFSFIVNSYEICV